MQKDVILKMKRWMFECTGEWNVFAFTDEQTVEAYKTTLEAYEKKLFKPLVNRPPFAFEDI